MSFTIFRHSELAWRPRSDESGRTIAGLSDSMTSRAQHLALSAGRARQAPCGQGAGGGFVVVDGTLTVDLGEPPERYELERGSVLVVQPGTILQFRNTGDEELVLFIYGAPPEQGGPTSSTTSRTR